MTAPADPKLARKPSVSLLAIVRLALLVIGPRRGRLVLLCILAVVAGITESVLLYLVARLATALSVGDAEVRLGFGPLDATTDIEQTVITAFVVLSLFLLVSYPVASLAASLSQRAIERARRRLVGGYLGASWALRSRDPEGHLQEFVTDYCQRSERLVLQVSTMTVAAFGLISVAVVATVASPLIALFTFTGLLGVGLALRPLSRRVASSALIVVGANRALASRVAQTARVGQEIASFRVEESVIGDIDDYIVASGRAVHRIRFASTFAPVLFQTGALGIIIALCGALSRVTSIDITEVGPVLLMLVRSMGYARTLQSAKQSANELAPHIMGLEAELARLARHAAPRGRLPLAQFEQIVLTSVAFSYDGEHTVLSDVDLTIPKGSALGVVGPSGAGKSTLIQLLVRLRAPTSGSIHVNDIPLADVTADAWAQMVAFVPQDNKLVSGTVADNIRFFRPHIPLERVTDAARGAHLDAEIAQLPDGFNTVIGPGGRDLSVGQRQRLGIARALAGSPQVLVLDEPTSALDERSEKLIRQTLSAVADTTTLIIIAHRAETLKVCTAVIRVADGSVSCVAWSGSAGAHEQSAS